MLVAGSNVGHEVPQLVRVRVVAVRDPQQDRVVMGEVMNAAPADSDEASEEWASRFTAQSGDEVTSLLYSALWRTSLLSYTTNRE